MLLSFPDSTASLRTRHTKFRRSPDTSYQVPILVSDSGNPKQNATYIIIGMLFQALDLVVAYQLYFFSKNLLLL